jgi:hypothetical protein
MIGPHLAGQPCWCTRLTCASWVRARSIGGIVLTFWECPPPLSPTSWLTTRGPGPPNAPAMPLALHWTNRSPSAAVRSPSFQAKGDTLRGVNTSMARWRPIRERSLQLKRALSRAPSIFCKRPLAIDREMGDQFPLLRTLANMVEEARGHLASGLAIPHACR